MRIFKSKIFDVLNYFLFLIQNKLDIVRQKSFLLSKIDYFILIFLYLTLIVSAFATTEQIALVAIWVPILVVIKVFITKGEKVELEQSNLFLLLYLIVCLISCFTSSMFQQSLYGFMKTIVYFAFYFAMCQFLKNNKKFILPILFVIASIIAVESFIGIYQNSLGVANISTWQDTSYVNPEDVLTRVYGTLKPYNPNLFGGYLIAGVTSGIGLIAIYLYRKHYKSSLVMLILSLVAFLTIFLTGCRGAYLALASILFAITVISYFMVFTKECDKKIKNIWSSIVSIGTISSIIFLFLNQSILKRILSIFILRADSSTSFRMNVYNSAIQMFQDNWLFGIGVGNKVFREIYGLYMLSGFDALSCYCVPLEIAVESGIVALLLFIFFLFSLFYSAIKKIVQVGNFEYKIFISVAMVSIFAVLIHGIFDTIFFRPQVQFVFWTMVAITTVLVRRTEQSYENTRISSKRIV